MCLATSPPIFVIHGDPKQGLPVPFFGGYAKRTLPTDEPIPRPFHLEDLGSRLMEGDVYFSWTPLTGVVSTSVYYDGDAGFCRGIEFGYQNRGPKASAAYT